MKRIGKLSFLTTVASMALCGMAAAQQTPDSSLETVVVTATKSGATNAQDTPLTITAFSSDQLSNTMATNVKDLANSVPDLNISQSTSFAEIYIRGVGSNNTGNGSDPDVTVQVDGIYLARPYTQFADLLDVDRVEVLRGPQGTLYGRNAVGGTINIVSKQPSDTFQGVEQLTVGNYGEVQNQAYITGPIVPGELDFSLAANYARHDDYLQNISTGNNVFGQDEGGMRGQLRFQPASNLNATTRVDFNIASYDLENFDEIMVPLPATYVAQGGINNTILGNYTKVALNTPQHVNVTSFGVSEEVNYIINENLNVKSLTAYRTSMNKGLIDSDYTNINNAYVFQGESENQFTQEVDLSGHYDAADFVGGLFYFHENDQSSTYVAKPAANLRIGIPPLTHTDSIAGFAQGTYHLTETVSLIGGARYTSEQKNLHQDYNYTFLSTGLPTGTPAGLFDLSNHYDAFTPKGGVNWQARDNLLFYFSVTKGYKSGGYNYVASTPAAASFKPEKLLSYEAGEKSEWFDHKLRANLTGFIYQYQDLQVNQLISPGVVSISNAANAHVKGLELELTALPVSGLQLTANLSRLDARYSNYPNAPLAAALGTGTINATGNYLDAAPPYSAYLSAQYDWALGQGDAYVRAEYSWQDRVFYDPSNYLSQSQGAYGLINMFAGYNWIDNWQAQLWVKNLTNKEYIFGAAANGLVPTGEAGAPRTFGIRLTKAF
jgi:iron complex outermembrane recepter protein